MSNVSTLIKLLIALFFLLGGIKILSGSLKEISGSYFHDLLKKHTVHTGWAFFWGAIATILFQSSSAVTVMVIGFIHGGIFNLKQGLSIVLGANLGTTVTSQVFALESGILIYPMFIIGAFLLLLEWVLKKRLGGKIVFWIAVIFKGIELLRSSLEPLYNSPFFQQLYLFNQVEPWKGILFSAIATAIIQSSSAIIGMAVFLAKENMISTSQGLAIILGADLGTCVTSLVASIGTVLPARRVAWGHFIFNAVSIFLILPFWDVFLWLIRNTSSDFSRQVANAHLIYNFIGVLVFLPIVDIYAKLLEYIIKDFKK